MGKKEQTPWWDDERFIEWLRADVMPSLDDDIIYGLAYFSRFNSTSGDELRFAIKTMYIGWTAGRESK